MFEFSGDQIKSKSSFLSTLERNSSEFAILIFLLLIQYQVNTIPISDITNINTKTNSYYLSMTCNQTSYLKVFWWFFL